MRASPLLEGSTEPKPKGLEAAALGAVFAAVPTGAFAKAFAAALLGALCAAWAALCAVSCAMSPLSLSPCSLDMAFWRSKISIRLLA